MAKIDAKLEESWFGIEPNVAVMHQVVTAQLAARRAGTHSTRTRAEVRGGGAKPWRQKGTGRARQGSIRAPHWRGGGIAHGPKPRNYAQRTPKKMIRLALRSALSDRAAEGKVLVVDDWGFDVPSTKAAVAALADLGTEGKVLVVLADDDTVAQRSFRNLPSVQTLLVRELNAYDVLVNDWVVFTEATLPSDDRPVAPAPEPEAAPVDEAEAAADEPEAAAAGSTDESVAAPVDEAEAAADEPEAAASGSTDESVAAPVDEAEEATGQ